MKIRVSALAGFFAALLWVASGNAEPTQTDPAVSIFVEMDAGASKLLDAEATRRLIELELSDLDLELWQSAAKIKRPSALLFRVSARGDETLQIELWDVGAFYGARRISSSGSKQLTTRRLSLASAELARAVQKEYKRELLRREALTARQARLERSPEAIPLYASLRLNPELYAAAQASFAAYLFGPRLGVSLDFERGPRLDLGFSWQLGSVEQGSVRRSMRWGEAYLAPGYVFPIASSELHLGFLVSAASVSIRGASSEAPNSTSLDQWSGRIAVLSRFRFALGPRARFGVGAEVGELLRPISTRDVNGERLHLGGVWLGLSLGVELTVAGADGRR